MRRPTRLPIVPFLTALTSPIKRARVYRSPRVVAMADLDYSQPLPSLSASSPYRAPGGSWRSVMRRASSSIQRGCHSRWRSSAQCADLSAFDSQGGVLHEVSLIHDFGDLGVLSRNSIGPSRRPHPDPRPSRGALPGDRRCFSALAGVPIQRSRTARLATTGRLRPTRGTASAARSACSPS